MVFIQLRIRSCALALLGFVLLVSSINADADSIRAFPEAEGFGAYAVGGRGGKLFAVTTLEDNGPGSAPIPGSLPIMLLRPPI